MSLKHYVFALKNSPYFIFILIFIGALILAWLLHTAGLYPYYFSFDMDLVTAEDFLIVGSGFIPDHQVHPGVGMLVLLQYLSPLAKYLGLLSASSLEELSSAVSPLLILANTTAWLRSLSPILLFSIGLLCSSSLIRHFRLNFLTSLLLLVVFCLSISVSYHAIVNRTEQYSVLFLTLTWLCMLISSQTIEIKKYLASIFLSGIFFGLTYITKVQSLVVLAATFLLFIQLYILRSSSALYESELYKFAQSQNNSRIIKLNFFLFFVFSGFGALVRVTDAIHHNREGFGLTPWWFALTLYLASSALLLNYQRNFKAKQSPRTSIIADQASALFSAINILILGVLVSYLIHLLLYADIFQGIRHLLLSFKITMFGKFNSGTIENVTNNRSLDNVLSQKYLIVLYTATAILIFRNILKSIVAKIKLAWFIALLIWAFLAIHIIFATRSLSSVDIIWAEIPILFLGLFFIFQSQIDFPNKNIQRLIFIFLLIYATHGLSNALSSAPRRRSSHMQESIYYKNIYGGNQDKIKNIMDLAYPENVSRSELSFLIRHPMDAPQNWQNILPELNIKMQKIGFLQNYLPVFGNSLNLRLTQIPKDWLSSSSFDIQSYFNSELTKNKITQPLQIMNKFDQKIAIFVEASRYNENCQYLTQYLSQYKITCAHTPLEISAEFIQLTDSSSKTVSHFLPIILFEVTDANAPQFMSLDLTKLSGRFFLAAAKAFK